MSAISILKISEIFILNKRAVKKQKVFIFLKDHYFVMGGPIDMNLCVFWETSKGLLKSVVLQLFAKYS